MKRLVGRLFLLLLAKLARRQAWKLARRTVGEQVKRRGGKLARTLLRRASCICLPSPPARARCATQTQGSA